MSKNSVSITVTEALYFGTDSVVKVEKDFGEDKVLVETPRLVGYKVKNTGSKSVGYKTSEYYKNSDNMLVYKPVDGTLEPGDEIYLTRKYMTIFAAQPEIMFVLSNGKMSKSETLPAPEGYKLDVELESYFVDFDKDSKHAEIQIGELAGTAYTLKSEYEKTFGYLYRAV